MDAGGHASFILSVIFLWPPGRLLKLDDGTAADSSGPQHASLWRPNLAAISVVAIPSFAHSIIRVFSSIEMSFLLPIVKHGDENGKKK
jgi:hypothetical protein